MSLIEQTLNVPALVLPWAGHWGLEEPLLQSPWSGWGGSEQSRQEPGSRCQVESGDQRRLVGVVLEEVPSCNRRLSWVSPHHWLIYSAPTPYFLRTDCDAGETGARDLVAAPTESAASGGVMHRTNHCHRSHSAHPGQCHVGGGSHAQKTHRVEMRPAGGGQEEPQRPGG